MAQESTLQQGTVKTVNDADLHTGQFQAQNEAVGGLLPEQPELFAPKDFREPVESLIARLFNDPSLDRAERVILDLLIARWGKPITQEQIARTEPWLGCHPTHEKDIVANELATTTRKVRSVVRSLRVTHKVPILSDLNGYYLPVDNLQCSAYLTRTGREAHSRAKSSIETYHAMKSTLGIVSDLFESFARFATEMNP